MPDSPRFLFKPSQVLGLLLVGEAIFFALFVNWFVVGAPVVYLPYKPPDFDSQKWILTVAAMAAMVGWTVSSLVTVKNSIKQHTINTLLQSRLSETYMKRAGEVNAHFTTSAGQVVNVKTEEIGTTEATTKLECLRYILNYFEFIAVGIRYGDLHEGLLKSSLRGMLCKTYEVADAYVKHLRTDNPKVYEHLEWLYKRWNNK